MSMIEITADTVRTGLTALVDEYGSSTVYEKKVRDGLNQCLYVYEGQPDCIIGKFLADLGVEVELLAEYDTTEGIISSELLTDLARLGIIASPPYAVYNALSAAQALQDEGKTWGAAVMVALGKLGAGE
jgi:hypothetical protein